MSPAAPLLGRLAAGESLSSEEAGSLLGSFLDGAAGPVSLAALLTALRLRGPTHAEFRGVVDAVFSRRVPVDLGRDGVADVCGTGGDGKDTFNVSTAAAFVVAAAGVPVAKHGNHAVTSAVGSSDVLGRLGVTLTSDPGRVRRDLDRHGVCFLNAPLFHPSLGAAGPVRRELGFRTILNLVGPLVNPCAPRLQMIGLADRGVSGHYEAVLKARGTDYCLVSTDDGYDEVSLTAPWTVTTPGGTVTYHPADFGGPVDPGALGPGGRGYEGAVEEVLRGTGPDAHLRVVAVNAAFALALARPGRALGECLEDATGVIRSGRAGELLDRIRGDAA